MNREQFEARVAEIVARADGPDIQIREDIPDKRIKIAFKSDPGEEVKKLMRSHGWRFVGGPNALWVKRLDQWGRNSLAIVLAELAKLKPDWTRTEP